MGRTPGQLALVAALRTRLDVLADVPPPGKGATIDRWRTLWNVAADDLALARLVEGHLDALAILDELGRSDLVEPGAAWGVWAAQPDGLIAERVDDGWHLHGTKGWCSGSSGLDAALVTATSDSGPRLFAVDPARLEIDDASWSPIGMAATASHTIRFDVHLPLDDEVGAPGAYVDRVGFWHGSAGVAACWYGGAHALLGPLRDRVERDGPTGAHITARAFGTARARLDAAHALLERAATRIDADPTDIERAHRDALAVRLVVEETARRTIDTVNVALGAGPLCEDSPHSRRVADLMVYLRQLDVARAAVELAELDPPASTEVR